MSKLMVREYMIGMKPQEVPENDSKIPMILAAKGVFEKKNPYNDKGKKGKGSSSDNSDSDKNENDKGDKGKSSKG